MGSWSVLRVLGVSQWNLKFNLSSMKFLSRPAVKMSQHHMAEG